MTTRTIVTSQPDVACDVCERRLLRGEQHDVFLVTGRRRVVCELCVPRAVHEGWHRESDQQSVSLPPLRPRRGRSLLDRLPVSFRVPGPFRARPEGQAYDLLDADEDREASGAPPAGHPEGRGEALEPAIFDGEGGAALAGVSGEREPPSPLHLAVELFNLSEYPRRIAGVARSLGAPEVNVRSAEHAASVVRILVAWELCWYRYEVDLDEPENGARVIAQGTELSELEREDRLVNGRADDAGRLALSGI